ncbi:MAG: tyrosine-type recombinase/integrase [Anaerovoracaceae bacterium]
MRCDIWFQEWLEKYKEPSVSERTYKDYCYMIKLIDLSMPLKNVKPIHLQEILNRHANQSLAHVKKLRMTMKQVFECAVDNHLLNVNPANKLSMPSTYNNKRRPLTVKERTYILKLCETHYAGKWIKIMLYCGCRPGETDNLQGMDIDPKNDIMHIRGTKTASADRYVPIPHNLALEFKNVGPFDYLFTTKHGTKLNEQSRKRWWNSFKRELNISMGCKMFRNRLIEPFPVADDLVPYLFRHTFCTDLQLAGIDINIAKELMGHSNISVTANIYTHFTDQALADASKKLEDFRVAEI